MGAQTTQTMSNVADRLAEAGAGLGDVVKTLCFLTDMSTFAEFNEAYAAAFGDHRPARSTVGRGGAARWHGRRGRGLGVQAGVTAPQRCPWAAGAKPLDIAYHDTEWGVPRRDPTTLFEFLVLEGAQAGLSWSTILAKRDGYRAAFAGFDPVAVAAFTDDDVARCLADPGIVRNRAKIAAAVDNARAWLELDDPVAFVWDFVDGAPIRNRFAA